MPTDPLTLARDRAQENLFWRHLEVNVEDAGEGWVKLRVPVKDGRGRTIAFGEARISDASGRLVAVGRATYMLLTSKP